MRESQTIPRRFIPYARLKAFLDNLFPRNYSITVSAPVQCLGERKKRQANINGDTKDHRRALRY